MSKLNLKKTISFYYNRYIQKPITVYPQRYSEPCLESYNVTICDFMLLQIRQIHDRSLT